MSALGLPRGGAHKGVAPAKKKKKVTRAKPSRNVLCDYHQALGRKKKKKKSNHAIFFKNQKLILLVAPGRPSGT